MTRYIYVYSLYEQNEFEKALEVIESVGVTKEDSSHEAKLTGGVHRIEPENVLCFVMLRKAHGRFIIRIPIIDTGKDGVILGSRK